jgi:hypothetical protein
MRKGIYDTRFVNMKQYGLLQQDDEEFAPGMRQADYDNYENYDDHDNDYDYEPMKDLTACDEECGYCGNCDY